MAKASTAAGVLLILAAALVAGVFILRQRLSSTLSQLEDERLRANKLKNEVAVLVDANSSRSEAPAAVKTELLRLRAQVTRLGVELSEVKAEKARVAAESIISSESSRVNGPRAPVGDRLFQVRTNAVWNPHDEGVRHALNEKEEDLQVWWQAFLAYAKEHSGDLPIDFSEAAQYLPSDFRSRIDLSNFEKKVSRGNLARIGYPKRTVILKEREPLVLSDGVICKVYLFADGHVELFRE